MTISTDRTIIIGRQPRGRPLQWPVARVGANLDYSLDATAPLLDVGDSIASVSLSVAPSGTGELQALDLTVVGNLITAQLSGGVAGRLYSVRMIVAGLSGRVWEWDVGLPIDPKLAPWPLSVAPSPGFGPTITWTSGVTVFSGSFLSVLTGLISTGTTQATALPLPAQTSAFGTVAAGTGAILPANIVTGKFYVTNAGANDLLVYPPVGAQIGAYGVNIPVAISPNQTVSFSTNSPTTEWIAA